MKALVKILRAGSITTDVLLFGYIALAHELVYDFFLYDLVLEVSGRVIREGR